MTVRDFYDGTNGDNILAILRERRMKPDQDGQIFFSQFQFESVLMHGPDATRGAAFAIKVRVELSERTTVQQKPTPGIADTVVVQTTRPIVAEVLELYVRPRGALRVQGVRGAAEIVQFLRR